VDVARAAQAHAPRVASSFLKIERIPFLVLVFDPEGGLFRNNVRLMRFSQEYLSYRSISETPGQPIKVIRVIRVICEICGLKRLFFISK